MIAAQLRVSRAFELPCSAQAPRALLMTLQFSEGSRVMVRRADREAAEKFIADLGETADATAPIDDDTLASLADESKGWSDPSTGAVV
jgi:hypothetical protein